MAVPRGPAKSEQRSAEDAHYESGATVQAPRLFARVVMLWPLLAVADRADAVGADPAAHQILAHGAGAPVAERDVVLRRADVAGVSFDLDSRLRILLHRLDGFIQGARRFGTQRVAVKIEM